MRAIVFGGTTEGRQIAAKLASTGELICVCVATDYGETFLDAGIKVNVGRLDVEGMVKLIGDNKPDHIIDATHPYAVEVTKNIKEACRLTGVSYERIRRESEQIEEADNIHSFKDISELIPWLDDTEGIIFSTLGVKEARALTEVSDWEQRIYIRVLPNENSLSMCDEAGYEREHVIASMGPFSYEENIRHFRETGASILLTKESGKAGGFLDKIKAANDLNMMIAVITRPED